MSESARAPGVVNWDELDPWPLRLGHLDALWVDLGRAVGSRQVGLRRITIGPDDFSTPVHVHGQDEEIFFVLDGEGLLWQGGRTFAVGARDCIVHRPRGEAHTLRGGGQGLDVLAFGQRVEPSLAYLPRAGVSWSIPTWVEAGQGDSPYEREVAAGPPDCPPPAPERPSNVITLQEAPAAFGGLAHQLGAGAGAMATGLNHIALPAGSSGPPAHCHSAEEEIFVILEGSGRLELYPCGPDHPETYAVRPGDVISHPPGTGIAHALRPGEQGLTYLAYGTREPNDMTHYPESGRIALRGLGVAFVPDGLRYRPPPS